MTRIRLHASDDDDRNALDDALEALVRGDRRGLDALDPEMRATVDQMYRWAEESGFRDEPLPATFRRAWGSPRWVSRFSSVAAAAILVGIIAFGAIMVIDMSRDDPAPEMSYGAGGETVVIDGNEFLTVHGAEQDVYRVFDEYQWPDGYTPTPDEIVNHFSGGDDREEADRSSIFTSGIGHGLVGSWHSCAWYMAWLDAYRSGDNEQQAEALHVMTYVLPYHSSNSAQAREYDQETARRAALGDPSRVAQRVAVNCERLSLADDGEDNGDTIEDGQ